MCPRARHLALAPNEKGTGSQGEAFTQCDYAPIATELEEANASVASPSASCASSP